MLLKNLRDEIDATLARDPAARSRIEVVLCYPGFHALVFHRLAHWLWRRGWLLAGRYVSHLGRIWTGIEIHPAAQIGKRLFIDHGMGVVIGETAEIGDDCTLYHGVTLGGRLPRRGEFGQKRHPTLGNSVIVGSGAQILGPFRVGDCARIGAGAVVISEVADGLTVVGPPARPVPRRGAAGEGKPAFLPYGIPGDIPDPIARALSGLLDEVTGLRARVAALESEPAGGADGSAEARPLAAPSNGADGTAGLRTAIMRLSTKGRYAVMAMVDLAGHSGGAPVSLAEIAERQEISLSYLEQLFAMLRKGGLIKSVRGPGGGYLLAHDRGEIRIADIILAVDEPIRAIRCAPGAPIGCRGNKTRCLTHDLWEELGNQIHLYLSSVSLADVCEHRVLGTSGRAHCQSFAVAAAVRNILSRRPVPRTETYLDWNATAPLRPEAAAAVTAALARCGNPSSVHRWGRAARAEVERARTAVAALVGVAGHGVVFVSGGTEANHLALLGAGRARVLVSALSSTIRCCARCPKPNRSRSIATASSGSKRCSFCWPPTRARRWFRSCSPTTRPG